MLCRSPKWGTASIIGFSQLTGENHAARCDWLAFRSWGQLLCEAIKPLVPNMISAPN